MAGSLRGQLVRSQVYISYIHRCVHRWRSVYFMGAQFVAVTTYTNGKMAFSVIHVDSIHNRSHVCIDAAVN